METVGGRGTFGPLLPLVASLAYPVVGRGIFGSLLVPPLFFVVLVGATFGLARRFVPTWWAVLAAFAVAAMPAVTDYTRLFHFALPAAACMTASLWALVRADGFRRARWSIAFGLAVGLTLLARTMTVAFIPGLALASGSQFLVAVPDVRARLRNLGLAVATAALVAGPWYLYNARSVYDLYLGSGYGEGATTYGRHYPIASWGYWTKELRIDLASTYLPLGAALLACIALGLAAALRGRRTFRPALPRSRRGVDLLALVLVVVEGYLALTTSRNEGTGFPLPWLPTLVVLAVVAAAAVPARAVRLALATALAAVSLVTLTSKSGSGRSARDRPQPRSPGLGPAAGDRRPRDHPGRGCRATATTSGRVTQPLPAMNRRWLPLARDVVGWSLGRAQQRREPLDLSLGLDDRIFGNSRLILAAQLWYYRYLPVDYLHAPSGGDPVASYRSQLLSPRREDALITGDPPPNGSSIARSDVERAARSLGFVRVKSFRMPDGRRLWIWWRERPAPAPAKLGG